MHDIVTPRSQNRRQEIDDAAFERVGQSAGHSACLCLPDTALAERTNKQDEAKVGDASRLKAETFSGLQLRAIGPVLMSGRIADVAVDPRDQSTWDVAVGSGGVWKTTNAGTTRTPVFDGQSSYSIGCVTVDPS